VSVPVADACCDLLGLFAGVSDGRAGQGRDHPVAAVLALAAAAVVAGMKGYTAITGWVAGVPPAILADLYLRSGAAPAPPPSKTTIWRVLTDADAGAFDVAVGTWMMNLAGFTRPATAIGEPGEEDGSRALMQVRLDGKAVRGARGADGNQVRLLAALAGPDAATSVVAAQAEVGVKTNEVPMAAVVPGQIDLNGKIVTADALHTVKATANHIHEHGGEFVFPVKGLFEVNRDGVSVRLPYVFCCWLRCVICAGGRGCRRCGRACADWPGYGIRMPGGLRAWRAGSGSRRSRS